MISVVGLTEFANCALHLVIWRCLPLWRGAILINGLSWFKSIDICNSLTDIVSLYKGILEIYQAVCTMFQMAMHLQILLENQAVFFDAIECVI